MPAHAQAFFSDVQKICSTIDLGVVEKLAQELAALRERGGRLFLLGVGGSAGNCSHAVNDFRKLCNIEAYTPVDNVSELSARANDEGFETIFSGWLEVSRISAKDALLIYSVGGGDAERNISANIVSSLKLAKNVGAKIVGVVGRDGGYTAKVADACVVIPPLNRETVTPQVEGFQAVVWHMVVSHPKLVRHAMKWESVEEPAITAR